MDHVILAPGHKISRVIKGGWQLSQGHSGLTQDSSVEDMIAFCDAGITTFDCADIYTGVEEQIGAFRKAYANARGAEALARIKVHTKCVPDLGGLATMTRDDLERTIDTSLKRLGVDTLDLVQFHWWDTQVPRYVEVAGWLTDLRQAGKITNLGGTNFSTGHVRELVGAGVPLVSMQVQYSLLDSRAGRHMADFAAQNGIAFLCYGTVAGGFLSDRWQGAAEPAAPLENRSLVKYKLIIDEFGGWDLFQALLDALSKIAHRHDTDIATIASAAMLERPQVAAVIVGARNRSHLEPNLAITDISLSDTDHAEIATVLDQSNLVPGDVYDVERDRTGPHGAIMKYNLNKGAA